MLLLTLNGYVGESAHLSHWRENGKSCRADYWKNEWYKWKAD